MTGILDKSEAAAKPVYVDAILNRARVNLARSQKLVEGWIPLSEDEKDLASDGRLQDQKVEDEFVLRPERAGLGADLQKLAQKSLLPGMSSNGEIEKLRKQMLGRNTIKHGPLPKSASSGKKGNQDSKDANGLHGAKRQRPASPVSDSDEGGRASSFKAKRLKVKGNSIDVADQIPPSSDLLEEHQIADEGLIKRPHQDDTAEGANSASKPGPKARGTFLDEVLAQRSKKNKRKKQKAVVRIATSPGLNS